MNKPASIKGNARELVLDTAELLFAEQGVEAVSLRAINAAAGVSPGVLHYHFGNRQSLIEALIDRRMHGLMAQRHALLTPLLQLQQPSLEAVIRALISPLAELALNGGDTGQRYIQFIAKLYAERSVILDKVSSQYTQTTTAHFPALIKKACPALSRSSINWRLAMANSTALQTLAELSLPPRAWQQENRKSPDQQVEELITFVIGGFNSTSNID